MRQFREKFFLSGILLLLVSFCCPGCRPGAGRQRPNLLLVTYDTLRADHVGCYGYNDAATPVIDGIAAGGVLFEYAYCQVPITLPSHASILSGLQPVSHGIRLNGLYSFPEEAPLISTILKKEGYNTGAFISACVLDRGLGLDRDFDVYADIAEGCAPDVMIRDGGETVTRAIDWLRKLRGGPFFMWLHIYDPHYPYDPPEPYASRFPEKPYDGEISYSDHVLGRLLKELELLGKSDSTLMVITSDHGEGLMEHGEWEHAYFVYDSTVRIPLIFKLPADNSISTPEGWQPGTRISSVAETVDIVPTIMSLLGIKTDINFDGTDISMPGNKDEIFAYSESMYPLCMGWAPLRSVRTEYWKYIHAPEPELYAYLDDPGETNNLYDNNRHIAEGLSQWLNVNARTQSGPEESSVVFSSDRMKKLQSLGYIASGALDIPSDELMSLPDPRERFHVFRAMTEARSLSGDMTPQKAIKKLEALFEGEEENPVFLYVLGLNYLRAGGYQNAIRFLRKASELNPDNVDWRIDLAEAALKGKKPLLAEQYLRSVVDRIPASAEAWDLLGIAFGRSGRLDEAIAAGHKAVELNRAQPSYRINLGQTLLSAGRDHEAGKVFLRGIEQGNLNSEQQADMKYQLAVVLVRQGSYGKAEKLLRQTLALKPDHQGACGRLLEVCFLLNKREEAKKLVSQLPGDVEKLDPVAAYYAGRLYLDLGDTGEAIKYLERASDAMPSFAPARNALEKARN